MNYCTVSFRGENCSVARYFSKLLATGVKRNLQMRLQKL